MKKLLFLIVTISLFSANLYALEEGKWTFVKDDDYCYIGSMPTETDLPKNKKRGENYILVYKMKGNEDSVIQIEPGYSYDLSEDIIVKIDNADYIFYTTEESPDSAWTNEDSKVIYAMKKGLDLNITGKSNRGTTTNDKYTLKGFTLAFNKLNQVC